MTIFYFRHYDALFFAHNILAISKNIMGGEYFQFFYFLQIKSSKFRKKFF